ncbi:MAG: hypothetical protein ABJN40_05935 [Sneathiella sp.]
MAGYWKNEKHRSVNNVGGHRFDGHYDWTVGHAACILDLLDDGLLRTSRQIRLSLEMEKDVLNGTLDRLMRLGGVRRYKKPGVDQRLPAGVRGPGWLYRITDKGRKRKPPAD